MRDTIYRDEAIKVVSIPCRACLARDSKDCEKCSVPKLNELINAISSADKPQNVIAQITFDEEKLHEIIKEAIERFKEEYEVTNRPQGKWIVKDGVFYCSCCDNDSGLDEDDVYVYETPLPNYCYNCGARMKEAYDETD